MFAAKVLMVANKTIARRTETLTTPKRKAKSLKKVRIRTGI
jgi:hypothetical protein